MQDKYTTKVITLWYRPPELLLKSALVRRPCQLCSLTGNLQPLGELRSPNTDLFVRALDTRFNGKLAAVLDARTPTFPLL